MTVRKLVYKYPSSSTHQNQSLHWLLELSRRTELQLSMAVTCLIKPPSLAASPSLIYLSTSTLCTLFPDEVLGLESLSWACFWRTPAMTVTVTVMLSQFCFLMPSPLCIVCLCHSQSSPGQLYQPPLLSLCVHSKTPTIQVPNYSWDEFLKCQSKSVLPLQWLPKALGMNA